jgi:hypothetical protein
VEDCKLLQSDIDAARKWCLDNGINLSVDKTTFMSVTPITNSVALRCKLGIIHIARSHCVKDRWVLLDCRLCCHNHVDHIAAQAFRMLGFIRYITSSLSSFDTPATLYCSLVRSNWNLPLSPGILYG